MAFLVPFCILEMEICVCMDKLSSKQWKYESKNMCKALPMDQKYIFLIIRSIISIVIDMEWEIFENGISFPASFPVNPKSLECASACEVLKMLPKRGFVKVLPQSER